MVDHGHHISIGRFAGLTGISANTLRRYDESGLLSPAFTDPFTGYRLYAIEQLDTGLLIGLLRDLDVPLDEIRALLGSGGPHELKAVLTHHRERIVERRSRARTASWPASTRPSTRSAACCPTRSVWSRSSRAGSSAAGHRRCVRGSTR